MSLSVFMGRFWWCLEVHENSASISRIVKRRGKPAVDCTFSGTLEACRNYQNVNGGSAEGVILIDDITPVKVVFEKESFTLPGFETENFEFVDSVSGDFTVVAAKKSVEKAVESVTAAGFKILLHTPAVCYKVALSLESAPDGNSIFVQEQESSSDLWAFTDGEFRAYYRIAKGSGSVESLKNFVTSEYGIENAPVENFEASLAPVVANDAWVFKTTAMPAFSTLPDAASMKRLHEASLFRKTLKVAAIFVALSFLGTGAIGIINHIEESGNEKDRIAYEKELQNEKEFNELVKDLEKRTERIRKFLAHRSRTASKMALVGETIQQDSWITHWKIDGKVHSIQGLAANANEISATLQALEKSNNFVNVRLRTTEKTTFRRKPVIRFDIVAEAM